MTNLGPSRRAAQARFLLEPTPLGLDTTMRCRLGALRSLAPLAMVASKLLVPHRSQEPRASCTPDPYLAQINGVKRQFHTPFWERSDASFDKWRRTGPVLGQHLQMTPPPPIQYVEPTPTELHFQVKRPYLKATKISWPKQAISIDLERQIEIRKWKSIIEIVGPESCSLGQNLSELKAELDKWNVLLAVFHNRAPSTLRKHAGAMNLYMKWCHTCRTDPFPIAEQKTWDYCNFLYQNCAPATRADTFVQAARATIDLLSMSCSYYETNSMRIKGIV